MNLIDKLHNITQEQQQQQLLIQRMGHQQWNQGDMVQAGPVPTTTDHLWPAGLQAVEDLQHLSLHRSHIRNLPSASQLRETSLHLGSLGRQRDQTA